MNKLLTFIILLLLIGCCSETVLVDNGLNGEVKMLTEYNISVKSDSLNNLILDTLSTVKKYYNDLNQIVERNQEYSFVDETMDITFEYNRCNQIQRENVKMSFDSTTMVLNYIYENSLNKKSIAESIKDSVHFKQIRLNKYDTNKMLTESTLSQVFVDLKNNDTIKNSIQIDKYGENGLVQETQFKFSTDPQKNNRSEYFYEENELIEIKGFDSTNYLISTTRYEYEYDDLGNWIERKAFEENELKGIITRKIVYK